MEPRFTIRLAVALIQLCRIHHVHSIGPTVVNILDEFILVIAVRIENRFGM
jgi:hypothetical protein